MATQTLVVALLVAAPAASPEPSSAAAEPAAVTANAVERSPRELREAVHAALRRQATTKGPQQDAAVRELAAVYQELTASTRLTPPERRQLRAMVRSRLLRTSQALQRQIAGSAKQANKGGQLPAADREILAQVRPNAPAGPNAAGRPQNRAQRFGPGAQVAGAGRRLGRATNRNAQELIDLIQNVVAPSSWDVNGGLGTIMYFAPKQVLVIRARGDVHDQVGEAIEGLRGK